MNRGFKPGEADKQLQQHLLRATRELEQACNLCQDFAKANQNQAVAVRKVIREASVESAFRQDARKADEKARAIRQLVALVGRTGHLVQTAEPIDLEELKRTQQKKAQKEVRDQKKSLKTKPFQYEMSDGTE